MVPVTPLYQFSIILVVVWAGPLIYSRMAAMASNNIWNMIKFPIITENIRISLNYLQVLVIP